jgi:pyridoxal phosphate enzyme (YggS family)
VNRPFDPGDLASRLRTVEARIAAAGGRAVRVIAVTKGFGPEAAAAALAIGHVDLGENYAQELIGKAASLADPQRASVRWHFLGRLQRNKVKALAPLVTLWQSVDRTSVGAEIARRAPGAAVLVQVNLTGEPQKGGCEWREVAPLVSELRARELDVRGLMGVGPVGPAEGARDGFRRLVATAEELALVERSIGMTDDLEVAVEEGSTMVRIGRALFGPRPPR